MCRTASTLAPPEAYVSAPSEAYMWANERSSRIHSLEALLYDPTAVVPAAILQRALDFLAREIPVHEPPNLHMKFVFRTMTRWLRCYHLLVPTTPKGWLGYVKLLEASCDLLADDYYRVEWVDEWTPSGYGYWRRKPDADEADEAFMVVKAELESCRDMLGWETLPGLI